MSDNRETSTVLRLLKRNAPKQVYVFKDAEADTGISTATAAQVRDASKQLGFDSDPRESLPSFELYDLENGEEAWSADDFTRESVEEFLKTAKVLYKITTTNSDVLLSQEEYEALKPHHILEFSWGSYDIVVDLTESILKVGCQSYSFTEWQRRGAAIIRGEYGTQDEYATEALLKALPIIQERARELQPRRSRTKTSGRRSRRSSGRSRSRR